MSDRDTVATAKELVARLSDATGRILGTANLSEKDRLALGMVVLHRQYTEHKTQAEIAEELGISQPTVSRWKAQALRELGTPTADEARTEMLQIVERLLKTWMPLADAGDKEAAGVVQKLLDRWAKLTGADKPVVVEATVVEETLAERELRELLEQQKRDNAVRQAMDRGRVAD